MQRRVWTPLLFASLGCCTVNLEQYNGAQIRCRADQDCPGGLVCVRDLWRCRTIDAPCVEEREGIYVAVASAQRCTPQDGVADTGVCRGGECVLPECGDLIVDEIAGEECDDGNDDSEDGCIACIANVCGDGWTWRGVEACDDGNQEGGDGCRADCAKVETCGDGILDENETCDDGNANPNDTCYAVARNVDPGGCVPVAWTPDLRLGRGAVQGDPLRLRLQQTPRVAADRHGAIYVSDPLGDRVWKVHPEGEISVLAGTGTGGFSGDGGAPAAAQLDEPRGLAVDGGGNVYVADRRNHRIRKVCTDAVGCLPGTIATVVGGGTAGPLDGPALATELYTVMALVADGVGNIYFSDQGFHLVRRLCVDGVGCTPGFVTTVAGGGADQFGEDIPATDAQFSQSVGLAFDATGDLYISGRGPGRVRRVCLTGSSCTLGNISTVIGGGADAGEDVPALSVQSDGMNGVAVDVAGNIYFSEGWPHRVRRLCADGVGCTAGNVTTVAGTGAAGTAGINGPALVAELYQPTGLDFDPLGNLLIAEEANGRVSRLCLDAAVCTIGNLDLVAGGDRGRAGDGAAATTVFLGAPKDIAFEPNGNLLVAGGTSHQLWRVCLTGQRCTRGLVEIVAGTGSTVDEGNGGSALDAGFGTVSGLAVDPSGNIFLSSFSSATVRKICVDGVGCTAGNIDRFAGGGGQTVDDVPATDAALAYPRGLATDAGGNLYLVDQNDYRVRRVCVDGVGCTAGNIETIVGTGTPGIPGNDVPATSADLGAPTNIAFGPTGNLFLADSTAGLILELCLDGNGCSPGNVTWVAGTGTPGASGDGGPALAAEIAAGFGLVVEAGGNVITSGGEPGLLRRVCAAGVGCTQGNIDRIAGLDTTGYPLGDGTPAVGVEVGDQTPLAIDTGGNILFGDGFTASVRKICVDGVGCTPGHILTVAGGPVDPPEDGPFVSASLLEPVSLAWLTPTLMLVADGVSQRLRQVDFTGAWLSTVAGYPDGYADGVARFSRLLDQPAGVAVEGTGPHTIYLTERDGQTIQRITVGDPADPLTWQIETFAGVSGSPGPAADGALASAAFLQPSGLALDAANGQLYVCDTGNQVVRRIDLASETIATVVGVPGQSGFSGDGEPAGGSLLRNPSAVAIGNDGSLYIADTGNNRVRRVDPLTGRLTTVIGDGQQSNSGQGSPANQFSIDAPAGLTLDRHGNLYVAARFAVREVIGGSDGIATGTDTVVSIYGKPPRAGFPEAATSCLSGIGFAPDPNADEVLYILDRCQGFLVELGRVTVPPS